MKLKSVKRWFAHRIDPQKEYPVSLLGGLAALYDFGWDITATMFTLVYANHHGKRTLHVESRGTTSHPNGSVVMLWANKRALGMQSRDLF